MLYPLKIEDEDEVIGKGMQHLSISVMNCCNSNVEGNHLLESLRQEAHETHLKSGLTMLPQLSVNVIGTSDVESMFPGLRYSAEKKPWMEKRLGVGFSECSFFYPGKCCRILNGHRIILTNSFQPNVPRVHDRRLLENAI